MDYEEVQIAGDGELITKNPYVAWAKEDTRVVSYVLTYGGHQEPTSLRPGWRTAGSARLARAAVKAEFGSILEENAAGDHIYFRVRK